MSDDPVNHPSHYQQSPMETIEVIEGMGLAPQHHIANVIKYLARYKHKHDKESGKQMEDLLKAKWYLERLIDIENGD